MTTIDYDQMIAALDEQQSALNRTPCRHYDRADEDSTICLEPHPGEGPSWADMKPERMCPGCRSYWYLSMATDTLRRAKATAEIEAQEATR
jgi:hypothetical protein